MRQLLLLAAVLLPAVAAGQTVAAAPGVAQSDVEKRGETWFSKNCALCHDNTNPLVSASSQLRGVFKRQSVNEAAIRRTIADGVPKKMPAFRDALAPKEVDEIIAYLRIR